MARDERMDAQLLQILELLTQDTHALLSSLSTSGAGPSTTSTSTSMAGATPTFSFFSTSFGPTREDLTRSLGRHADSLAGLANSHWPLHELERARLARVKLALQRLRKANRLTRRTALLSGADQVRALAREAKEESERAARESERARVYNKLALPSSSSEQDADADDDDGQTVLGYARLLAPFTSAPPSSLRPDTAAAGESAEQQQQRLPAGGRVPFPTEAHLRAGRLWALSQGVQIPGRIPGGGETAEIGGERREAQPEDGVAAQPTHSRAALAKPTRAGDSSSEVGDDDWLDDLDLNPDL